LSSFTQFFRNFVARMQKTEEVKACYVPLVERLIEKEKRLCIKKNSIL